MAPVPAYDLSMDELSMALSYVSAGLITSAPAAAPAAAPAVAKSAAPAPAKAEKPKKVDDDDDFDVFGDDDDAAEEEEPTESRADMLARLKKEAEERTKQKEAKQRTLPGLKWGENCTLVEVAFGIKKIQTTFVMGVDNSSDEVQEAIEALEDEVQSVEIISMNVL
ncbi:hypothetical protein MHU86_8894 [Fragilaria crotonensis]|nr:hypothetical protein MHU86_8894 [Fragilaria crotonensis]